MPTLPTEGQRMGSAGGAVQLDERAQAGGAVALGLGEARVLARARCVVERRGGHGPLNGGAHAKFAVRTNPVLFRSLDRHRLRQVPGLVHVEPA